MRATWKPHEKHGQLTKRSDLPDSVFAFPKERKEPLTDARHVRNAAARFDQVEGVSEEERELAFANIKKAARYYDVDLSETSAKDFGKTGGVRKSGAVRKRSGSAKKTAKKAVATRKKATATRKRKKTNG